ncbi:hypothetical protein Peur_011894 [Populus x canadensis]
MCNKYLVFCKHLTITISISTAATVTISDVSITTTDVIITIPGSPLISTCLMLSLHNNEMQIIFNHFLKLFIYLFILYNLIQKKKQ